MTETILLFRKQSDYCRQAADYLKHNFKVDEYTSFNNTSHGNFFPPERYDPFKNEYDYVVSFLSPWIIPQWCLNKAQKFAINFHPAPTKYPGIGGYNYAIWNQDKMYGVTVHIMDEKVDTGDIIGYKRFRLNGNETVQILKEKTMIYLLWEFYEVFDNILSGQEIMKIDVEWACKPYTRKQFIGFCSLGNRPYKEIKRWLRATYFPNARDKPCVKFSNGTKYTFEKVL